MTAEAELDDLVTQYRRRAISRFDPATLVWLAALPEWTCPLAEHLGFPPGPGDPTLPDLLDRLDAAGLLARREDVDADGEPVEAFWLPASRRAEVGQVLRGALTIPAMMQIVDRLESALQSLPLRLMPPLVPWLEVVLRHRGDPTGANLLAAVEAAVTGERTVEALSLVGAAQALADLVGEPLASAARRAQWRIDRSYRDALDARALQHYLPRPDLDDALDELVTGRGAGWALHLLGDGGVGKTMTVRDLGSAFARRRGLRPFPVARVDFDHLDPRYPEGRPAELLLALSGELMRHSISRETEYWGRRTSDAVIAFDELAPSAPASRHDTLLDEAVTAFAGQLVAFRGPVVLVLDTCEELAKLHPPGGRAPAVDRTFDLLERLHVQAAPGLRVVLAGRRWLVPPPSGGDAGGLLLDSRPYLRVVPLSGFTPSQADAYLDRRDPAATIRPVLRTALLARSGGAGEVNPFDLASYCDWALAEPELDAAVLREGTTDPYVEQRIIARLPTDEVREALPVAVELGRFDRDLIGVELHRRGIDVDAALSGLVSQEWVAAVTFADDGRPAVLEVDERLLPRLRAVLAARPDSFPLDRARLGRDLADHVLTRPLDDPAISAVETALRLLAVDDAGRLWTRLEERIALTPGAWAWADQMTARAAAAEAARAREGGPTIMAAIRATQAACVLRRPGAPGAAGLWQDVARYTGRHPDAAVAARLTFLSLCAQGVEDVAVTQRLAWLWPGRPADVDDSVVALLDALTARGAPVPSALAPALDELCVAGDRDVAVTALLARASDRLGHTGTDAAVADVEHALRLLDAAASGVPRVHWTPAPRLRDRARLARVVLAVARGERPNRLPLWRWRADALVHTDDIDAERLVAATITHELCWHLVDPAALQESIRDETYRRDRQPTHRWHRECPTLCQAVAAGLAANGATTVAADALRGRREEAVRSGEDPATIAACGAQLATLSRASRTTTLTRHVRDTARDGDPDDRLDAWAALALGAGETPASPDEAGSWSIWFRTRAVRPWDPPSLAAIHAPPDADDLDRRELELLRGATSGVALGAARQAAREAVRRRLVVRRGRCADLGVLLRAEALDGWPDGGEPLLDFLPPRLVAETAMAEAELLALHLPEAALSLLDLARRTANAAVDLILRGRAATLLVLTQARAGRPTAYVRADAHLADSDTEGWASRNTLARQLLDDVPVDRLSARRDGSPELDVRPVGAGSATRDGWSSDDVAEPRESSPPAAGTSYPPPAVVRPRRWIAWALGGLTAVGVAAAVLVTPAGGGMSTPTVANVAPSDTSAPSVAALPTGEPSVPAGPTAAPTSGPATSRPDTPSTTDGSSSWLNFLIFLALVVGVVLVVVRVASRGWEMFQLRLSSGRSIALSPGGGTRSAMPCRLAFERPALVVSSASRLRPLRATRPGYLLVPLLGQRRGITGPGGEQGTTVTGVGALPGVEALVVRFRQSHLPVTWQLWDPQPSKAPRAEYCGPPALNATGQAPAFPSDETPVRGVLHLVGTPVSTAAGWRLRIDTGAPAAATVPDSRTAAAGELLVGPDDIRPERTALVVLQADPVDAGPRPLEERHDGMWALAADVRDAGAGAVLVLPPLPDALARVSVARVHAAMTRYRERTYPMHVLDLAHELRTAIAAAGSADARRAADDVLLFA